MDITPDLIASQIDAVFEDIDVDAVKIGMVSVPETIRVIADKLKQYQPPYIVIDPVMVATSGHRLLVPEAEQTLKEVLLPMADVLTPNLPEAEVLTGKSIESLHDMEEAAKAIAAMGAKAVLVKGGHRIADATDILFDGHDFHYYKETPGKHEYPWDRLLLIERHRLEPGQWPESARRSRCGERVRL